MIRDVIQGKAGWLFLRDGNNQATAKIEGRKLLTDKQLAAWDLELVKRKEHARKLGYQYRYIIVPDKQCVYSEFLPESCKISTVRPATQLLAAFPDIFEYLLPYLVNDRRELYYKTDTHWNHLGAVVALNQTLGQWTGKEIAYDAATVTIPGDLGKRFDPPRPSHSPSIKLKEQARRIFDNGINNIGRILVTKSSREDLPVGVVFGDSMFTNVVDIISLYFSMLYYFHASTVDYGVIEKIRPDYVISENVERFIGDVINESFKNMYMKKLYTIPFTSKANIDKFLTAPDIDTGVNYDAIKEYADAVRHAQTATQFEEMRIGFLSDKRLLGMLPRKPRLLAGGGWPGNDRTKFSGWGMAYWHKYDDNPAGFAIHLSNLVYNDEFTVRACLIEDNLPAIDPASLTQVWERKFLRSQLYIYSNEQEVFFPLSGMSFAKRRCYFLTIEGSAYLGCGSSTSDLPREDYLFRGYFKFQHDHIYRSVASCQSIACRFIFAIQGFEPVCNSVGNPPRS